MQIIYIYILKVKSAINWTNVETVAAKNNFHNIQMPVQFSD